MSQAMIEELWIAFALRSTVVLGAAAVLDLILRRRGGAGDYRRTLWTVALATVALLPALGAVAEDIELRAAQSFKPRQQLEGGEDPGSVLFLFQDARFRVAGGQ